MDTMITRNITTRIETKIDNDIFCSWFIDRLDTDDEGVLIEKILDHPECDCFVVYLKYKYDYEEEYVYTAQPCSITWGGNTAIMWFNDWWEGQQDVEYISVMGMGG